MNDTKTLLKEKLRAFRCRVCNKSFTLGGCEEITVVKCPRCYGRCNEPAAALPESGGVEEPWAKERAAHKAGKRIQSRYEKHSCQWSEWQNETHPEFLDATTVDYRIHPDDAAQPPAVTTEEHERVKSELAAALAQVAEWQIKVASCSMLVHSRDAAIEVMMKTSDERDTALRQNEAMRLALNDALPALRMLENQFASSLSSDSRSHDDDRPWRKRINVLIKLADDKALSGQSSDFVSREVADGLRDALDDVPPMAKSYAYEFSSKDNKDMVERAEAKLTAYEAIAKEGGGKPKGEKPATNANTDMKTIEAYVPETNFGNIQPNPTPRQTHE